MAITTTAYPPSSVTTINAGKSVLIEFTQDDLNLDNKLVIENTMGTSPILYSMEDSLGNNISVAPRYFTELDKQYIELDLSLLPVVQGTWKFRFSI